MERYFGAAASFVSRMAGKPISFIACCAIILIWAASGPLFGYSDTWQLIINTGTTIITFLMVFLIQNTQNRDGAAIQAKLDELIRVSRGENEFIGIEHLPEAEVEAFRRRCEEAVKREIVEDVVEEVSRDDAAKSAARKQSRGKAAGGKRRGRAAGKTNGASRGGA